MDSTVKLNHHASESISSAIRSDHTLTTMDTNTKVTNSLLSSVNPTPVPCGQCTTAQPVIITTPALQLAQLAHSGHVVVGGSRPTHALIQGSGVPALFDTLIHRGLPSRSALVAASNLREVQTLPRSMDHVIHQTGQRYQPVVLANQAGNAAVLPAMHAGQSYQVLAYPVHQQASGSVHSSGQKQSSVPVSSSVVLASVVVPDGSSGEANNPVRMAHVVSANGLPATTTTQLVVYYPQHVSGIVSQSTSITNHRAGDEQANTAPTVYYAVAPSDLLRQLQGNHPVPTDLNMRQQLLSTPSGLVLLQQHGPGLTAFKPHLNVPQKQLLGDTESSVLPKQSRPETGQRSGLICTCPPEVHQAIFEQQRRQQQLLHHGQSSQSSVKASECEQQPHVEGKTESRSYPKMLENGGSLRHFHEKPSDTTNRHVGSHGMQHQMTDSCCPVKLQNHFDHTQLPLASEEKAEKEAHVNYLVTLFKALKASGVQTEAFVSAFRRAELCSQGEKHRRLLIANKVQLEECRQSIDYLRQLHKKFKQKISMELKTCREHTVKLLNHWNTQVSVCSDPGLKAVREDRASLDRMLTDLRESKASLVEQLHDLECVIEQTGKDVLQHRCRITLPYVQTLDSRLDSITRAVGSTCVIYPEIRQRLVNQQEAELRAIELEKRLLDEQLHQLEDIGEKGKRIKGTILTLRRLAIVNVQNRHQTSSPRRFAHLGGAMNRAAADANSLERTRLYASIAAIQPDSEKRMQAIEKQEILARQKKRVLSLEREREFAVFTETGTAAKMPPPTATSRKMITAGKQSTKTKSSTDDMKQRQPDVLMTTVTTTQTPPWNKDEKRAPLAMYSDDSLGSSTTTSYTMDSWNLENLKGPKSGGPFNPGNIVSMIDETSDSTLETLTSSAPASILKAALQATPECATSPKPCNRAQVKAARGVMFSTTVTVDDGSEVVRLNCTLDESELRKNKVPPTGKQSTTHMKSSTPIDRTSTRGKISTERIPTTNKPGNRLIGVQVNRGQSNAGQLETCSSPESQKSVSQKNPVVLLSHVGVADTKGPPGVTISDEVETPESVSNAPTPPPRRSSQVTNASDPKSSMLKPAQFHQGKDYENLNFSNNPHSPNASRRTLPLPTSTDANELLVSPSE